MLNLCIWKQENWPDWKDQLLTGARNKLQWRCPSRSCRSLTGVRTWGGGFVTWMLQSTDGGGASDAPCPCSLPRDEFATEAETSWCLWMTQTRREGDRPVFSEELVALLEAIVEQHVDALQSQLRVVHSLRLLLRPAPRGWVRRVRHGGSRATERTRPESRAGRAEGGRGVRWVHFQAGESQPVEPVRETAVRAMSVTLSSEREQAADMTTWVESVAVGCHSGGVTVRFPAARLPLSARCVCAFTPETWCIQSATGIIAVCTVALKLTTRPANPQTQQRVTKHSNTLKNKTKIKKHNNKFKKHNNKFKKHNNTCLYNFHSEGDNKSVKAAREWAWRLYLVSQWGARGKCVAEPASCSNRFLSSYNKKNLFPWGAENCVNTTSSKLIRIQTFMKDPPPIMQSYGGK